MEKKQFQWYSKFQKPIRMVTLVLLLFFIYNLISKGSDNILLFKHTANNIDDHTHGFVLSSFPSHVMSYVRITSIALLILALVLLLVAEFFHSLDEDIWYKCQTIGIGICFYTGLFYPLSIISSGARIAFEEYYFNPVPLYCFFVLVAGAVFVCNVFYYKNKKSEFMETAKVTKIITYSISIIVFLGANAYSITNLVDKYTQYKEINEIIATQPDGYVDEIGYQMGNYSSEKAYYDGEYLYVVRDTSVYSIDKTGECKLFWKPEEIPNRLWRITIHNGYLYANLNNQLIRVNMNDKTAQTILECDYTLLYGIVGDKLYYYTQDSLDTEERYEIYYVDLNQEFSQANAKLYDKEIYDGCMNYDVWLGRYMYNQSDGYYAFYHNGEVQCYQGEKYHIIKDGTYDQEGPLENMDEDFILEYNVYSFNIFNGKIYYLIKNRDFELWSCDMYGNDKQRIGIFDQNSLDGEYIGEYPSLYMTEDYAVLDARISNDESKASIKKIMWLENGETNDIEFN